MLSAYLSYHSIFKYIAYCIYIAYDCILMAAYHDILHIFAYIVHIYLLSAYLSYHCIFTYFAYCIYFTYDCILILATFGDSEDEDITDPESGAAAAEDATLCSSRCNGRPGPLAQPATSAGGWRSMRGV